LWRKLIVKKSYKGGGGEGVYFQDFLENVMLEISIVDTNATTSKFNPINNKIIMLSSNIQWIMS
jgi:hypothetical protein